MRTFTQYLENKIQEKDNLPKHDDTPQLLQQILKPLPHKQQVEFALYCAKDVLKYTNEQTRPLAEKCIQLVEKWLINPKSVSNQELQNMASIASAAAHNTYTVWTVAYTVWTAADYAGSAAACAAYTANCAAYAAGDYDTKMQEYISIAKKLHATLEPSHHHNPQTVKLALLKLQDVEDVNDLSMVLDDIIDNQLIDQQSLHNFFHVGNINNNKLAELIWNKRFLLINLLKQVS